jgi:hypothetical protein
VCNRKIQWPTIPVWWQKKTCLSHGKTIAPFRLIYTLLATVARPLPDTERCDELSDWIFKHMIKWKHIYHTVGTVPAFNRKIVEICKFDIPNKHIETLHNTNSTKILFYRLLLIMQMYEYISGFFLSQIFLFF